jgi:hypothetical protein
MAMVRYPLPITNAMLAKANATHEGKPRYSTGADWAGGATGNEEDVATATSSIVDQNGTAWGPYSPKTQAQKATATTSSLVPYGPLQILDDLGKDTGAYSGQAGRTGPITPQQPYPDKTSPPIAISVTPNTGLAAGGFSITISGAGFTGATGVTVGGTAATAVTVVDTNTITATAPAKAAGPYGVIVLTPRGNSPPSPPNTTLTYT